MPIKFTKRYSVYNAGDVVSFAETIAKRLVESGVASFWTPEVRLSGTQKMVKKGK